MSEFQWIKLLGATGYLMLVIAAIGGIKGIPVKQHKILALIAVILITLHALLIIL